MTINRADPMHGQSGYNLPDLPAVWWDEAHTGKFPANPRQRRIMVIAARPYVLPEEKGDEGVPTSFGLWHFNQPHDETVLRRIPSKYRASLGSHFNTAYLSDQPVEILDFAELEEALQDLKEVPADAREEGMAVPSEVAFANAERLLKAMYRISPRRYGVYPAPDGCIAIDARGANGRIAVVMCDSDGGVLCLVTIDGEHRRARYSTDRQLPDGFIREALQDLGAEPA